ncbi:hypothetical protein E2562_030215 [Oryza meyeriana var. granulata]|uniref:Uncharacterized protein n=1 Tax=Oryza meyeriana var. granulata TaxID=110450 RepID=A0A6G1D870_9ORYZ|nr:hypothetical protein E2562_030215 [Oryza meyeriana var. granulata]
MRFAAVVAVVLLGFFLSSGGVAARPMASMEKTVTVAGRGNGVVVESWTTESSSQPSGCTNGNGAGGYCHPPAPAGH